MGRGEREHCLNLVVTRSWERLVRRRLVKAICTAHRHRLLPQRLVEGCDRGSRVDAKHIETGSEEYPDASESRREGLRTDHPSAGAEGAAFAGRRREQIHVRYCFGYGDSGVADARRILQDVKDVRWCSPDRARRITAQPEPRLEDLHLMAQLQPTGLGLLSERPLPRAVDVGE